jgi:hypothetical protein
MGSIPIGSEFSGLVKKIPSLCLIHSRVAMSCAPPSGWTVAEWTVDAGPLVMGASVRGFSRPGPLFRSLLIWNTGRAVFPSPAEFFLRKLVSYIKLTNCLKPSHHPTGPTQPMTFKCTSSNMQNSNINQSIGTANEAFHRTLCALEHLPSK